MTTTNITDLRNFAWHNLKAKPSDSKVSIYNINVGEWNVYIKCFSKEKGLYLHELIMHEFSGETQIINLWRYNFDDAEIPRPIKTYMLSSILPAAQIWQIVSNIERYEISL